MSDPAAPSADVQALAQVQTRIEAGLVRLADLITAVEQQATSIQARLARIERCQDRLEKLFAQITALTPA